MHSVVLKLQLYYITPAATRFRPRRSIITAHTIVQNSCKKSCQIVRALMMDQRGRKHEAARVM